MINLLKRKNQNILKLIKTEELQRLLKGYHYVNGHVNSPLIIFFEKNKKRVT